MAFAYSFGQSFVHSFIHSADTQCTSTYEVQVPSEPAGLAVTKRSFWPFSPFGLQSIYCVLNLHGLGGGRAVRFLCLVSSCWLLLGVVFPSRTTCP